MQKEDFFEGRTYKSGEFKGLIPKYYTKKYQNYINEEVALLKLKVKGDNKILEAGVGIGRLIPDLAPLVKSFIGIDTADFMIQKSQNIAKNYSNVEIFKKDILSISKDYPKNYFDYSLCVWNTLGNIKDPIKTLKELFSVTKKSIFITVFYKGTVKDRLELYKAIDVKVIKYDKEELFSLEGYTSKTFNENDIKKIANESGLVVKETKILGGVILWAELTK